MGQTYCFQPHMLNDEEFDRLCEAVTTAARQMTPAQVAALADSLYDIRRSKRRRVDLHRMIEELR